MRTTTVRLDDLWADMVEHVAKKERLKPSDVLREAVRYYMLAKAEDDPALDEMRRAAIAAVEAETKRIALERYGPLPDSEDEAPGAVAKVSELRT
jgi:predicted transcriptional regulator